MISGADFVVFGEDFGRHAHCLEHLMKQLWPTNRVIWVQTAGLRGPRFSLYDLRRVGEKIRAWGKRRAPVETPNLSVIAPFTLPYPQLGLVRRLNRLFVRRAVDRELRARGMASPFVITSLPNTVDYVRGYRERAVVYYCVDEFSLWAGIPKRLIAQLESELLSSADLVIATSQALQSAKASAGKPVKLLTHGVDYAHFAQIRKTTHARFTVGFFGLIDERIDQDLMIALCRRFPQLRFQLRGPVRVDTSALEALPNLEILPPVPYADLPGHLGETDVFILPYVRNELTRAIHPLKLKEYLATGRPVVATALEELEDWDECLFRAPSTEAFLETIEAIASGKLSPPADRQRQRAQAESWSAKAEQFSAYLEGIR